MLLGNRVWAQNLGTGEIETTRREIANNHSKGFAIKRPDGSHSNRRPVMRMLNEKQIKELVPLHEEMVLLYSVGYGAGLTLWEDAKREVYNTRGIGPSEYLETVAKHSLDPHLPDEAKARNAQLATHIRFGLDQLFPAQKRILEIKAILRKSAKDHINSLKDGERSRMEAAIMERRRFEYKAEKEVEREFPKQMAEEPMVVVADTKKAAK